MYLPACLASFLAIFPLPTINVLPIINPFPQPLFPQLHTLFCVPIRTGRESQRRQWVTLDGSHKASTTIRSDRIPALPPWCPTVPQKGYTRLLWLSCHSSYYMATHKFSAKSLLSLLKNQRQHMLVYLTIFLYELNRVLIRNKLGNVIKYYSNIGHWKGVT